jgi:hypothetical protein
MPRVVSASLAAATILTSLGCGGGTPTERANASEAEAIASDIRVIRLAIEEGNPPLERITEISPSGIYALRPTSPGASERIERMTSTFEWKRLCQLVRNSGLFAKQGTTVLATGSHAGVAAITIKYASGAESTVIHRAYYAGSEPPFWTLIRVIEGSVIDARPLEAESVSR